MIYSMIEWQTLSHIERQLNVNTTGTIRVTKALLPFLRKNKGLLII